MPGAQGPRGESEKNRGLASMKALLEDILIAICLALLVWYGFGAF
jgi:hypothetical protein